VGFICIPFHFSFGLRQAPSPHEHPLRFMYAPPNDSYVTFGRALSQTQAMPAAPTILPTKPVLAPDPSAFSTLASSQTGSFSSMAGIMVLRDRHFPIAPWNMASLSLLILWGRQTSMISMIWVLADSFLSSAGLSTPNILRLLFGSDPPLDAFALIAGCNLNVDINLTYGANPFGRTVLKCVIGVSR
jgi:hypothetical protein